MVPDPQRPVRIALVREGSDAVASVRTLLDAYRRWLGEARCFEERERELADLPGPYRPPAGGLWIAGDDADPLGCVALGPIDPGRAELRRLYVAPAGRGRGIGRLLALTAIEGARAAGYGCVLLDTLPERMPEAALLYRSLGFGPASPFKLAHPAGARCLRLDLDRPTVDGPPPAPRARPGVSPRSGSRSRGRSG